MSRTSQDSITLWGCSKDGLRVCISFVVSSLYDVIFQGSLQQRGVSVSVSKFGCYLSFS